MKGKRKILFTVFLLSIFAIFCEARTNALTIPTEGVYDTVKEIKNSSGIIIEKNYLLKGVLVEKRYYSYSSSKYTLNKVNLYYSDGATIERTRIYGITSARKLYLKTTTRYRDDKTLAWHLKYDGTVNQNKVHRIDYDATGKYINFKTYYGSKNIMTQRDYWGGASDNRLTHSVHYWENEKSDKKLEYFYDENGGLITRIDYYATDNKKKYYIEYDPSLYDASIPKWFRTKELLYNEKTQTIERETTYQGVNKRNIVTHFNINTGAIVSKTKYLKDGDTLENKIVYQDEKIYMKLIYNSANQVTKELYYENEKVVYEYHFFYKSDGSIRLMREYDTIQSRFLKEYYYKPSTTYGNHINNIVKTVELFNSRWISSYNIASTNATIANDEIYTWDLSENSAKRQRAVANEIVTRGSVVGIQEGRYNKISGLCKYLNERTNNIPKYKLIVEGKVEQINGIENCATDQVILLNPLSDKDFNENGSVDEFIAFDSSKYSLRDSGIEYYNYERSDTEKKWKKNYGFVWAEFDYVINDGNTKSFTFITTHLSTKTTGFKGITAPKTQTAILLNKLKNDKTFSEKKNIIITGDFNLNYHSNDENSAIKNIINAGYSCNTTGMSSPGSVENRKNRKFGRLIDYVCYLPHLDNEYGTVYGGYIATDKYIASDHSSVSRRVNFSNLK